MSQRPIKVTTLSASPTKAKNIRWSLVISANGAMDVGSKAAANHINPKAMGLVSAFAEVLKMAISDLEEAMDEVRGLLDQFKKRY